MKKSPLLEKYRQQEFLQFLRIGRITAQMNYGAPGWVSQRNIDLWRQSGPVGDYVAAPTCANFAMSGPQICAHLWEHHQFSNDPVFLRETAASLSNEDWPMMAVRPVGAASGRFASGPDSAMATWH